MSFRSSSSRRSPRLCVAAALGLSVAASAQLSSAAPTAVPSIDAPSAAHAQPVALPQGLHEIRDAGAPVQAPVAFDDDRAPVGAKDGGGPRAPMLGFAAGPYAPPPLERIDPQLAQRLKGGYADARPNAKTYAFALFSGRITPERVAALEARGVEVLGFHPEYALSVAITAETVGALLDEPAVAWIGDARPWQKVHPALATRLADGAESGLLDLYVSVFDSDLCELSTSEAVGADWQADPGQAPRPVEHASDVRRWHSNGWQQRELEARGAIVTEYSPSVRAFRVRIAPSRVVELVALDAVQFVELVTQRFAEHGRSTPFIHSDLTRAFWPGSASGEVVAGTIDSGMYISHEALSHAYTGGWDPLGNPPFVDACGHGSHVIGTVLAEPPAAHAQHRGNAPGLGFSPSRRFRQIHELGYGAGQCSWSGVSEETLFGWMASTYTDGFGNVSPRPHVINNSYSGGNIPGGWIGSETACRFVDDAVWNNGQVYVFAAGNYGPNPLTLGPESSAKNSFSVANVLPYAIGASGIAAGTLANDSSRGPCTDGRWRPNISAPGSAVLSVQSGTSDQYTFKWGTSMAAPHVTGVIAQMLDHYDFLRYDPVRTHSLLMATAALQDNQPILSHSHPTLNSYGAGRIDAFRANITDSEFAVLNWVFTQTSGTSAMNDFTVFPGCQRLVVVLHWLEPKASSGASQALINDLDLYIDAPPLTSVSNDGDYTAGLSSVDNTEIRVIDNPSAGTWRWKSHPYSTTSSSRVSVTVHQITSDLTPNATFSLTSSHAYAKPNQEVTLTAAVSSPSAILPAVVCDVAPHSATVTAQTMTLKDSTSVDMLQGEYFDNNDAALGAIEHGGSRSVQWKLKWPTEGVKSFQVATTAETGFASTQTKFVTIDQTPPTLPTGLTSNHTVGQWSKNPSVTWNWNASADAVSGLAGYSVFVNPGPPSSPNEVQDLGTVTGYTQNVATTTSAGVYFTIKPVDLAGNWNTGFSTHGPVLIDATLPQFATNLHSTSHTVGAWSNEAQLDMAWTAATDVGSGLSGYSWNFSTGSPTIPSTSETLGNVTSASVSLSGSALWYSLRAHDVAGNWSALYASAGPYYIDLDPPTNVSVAPPALTSIYLMTLSIGASDALSGVDSMRIKNDGGAFSPWEPFATSKLWALNNYGGSTATGSRTITIEVRDVAGNVKSAIGSTYLYTAPTTFGLACSGSLGTPGISTPGFAKIGANFTLNVTNTAALAKVGFIGFSKTNWQGVPLPFDLAAIGSAGCALNISPDFQFKKDGASTWTGYVPSDPTLVGTDLFFQWALVGDPSGKLVVTTQGLQAVVHGL